MCSCVATQPSATRACIASEPYVMKGNKRLRSPFSGKLLAQAAVLFLEGVDHVAPVLARSGGERNRQEQWIQWHTVWHHSGSDWAVSCGRTDSLNSYVFGGIRYLDFSRLGHRTLSAGLPQRCVGLVARTDVDQRDIEVEPLEWIAPHQTYPTQRKRSFISACDTPIILPHPKCSVGPMGHRKTSSAGKQANRPQLY